METKRIVIPEAEEIIDGYFPVLDHGFVALKDYMGGDSSVEESARVSYGGGTRKVSDTRTLLRYLFRHRHWSPFEMTELRLHIGLPIFVMRQLVRHRTACLTGFNQLHFDLPGGINRRGNQLYKLTVKDVFDKFNNHEFGKSRIQRMKLRCLNEETQGINHTNITDIWSTGKKEVYQVIMNGGHSATMSADHLCYTSKGWMKLKEAIHHLPTQENQSFSTNVRFATIGPGINTGVIPSFNEIDTATEIWKDVINWEGWYVVSNQGRVKRVIGGKGSRSFGKCKQITVSNNHAVVSLNKPGLQETKHVHVLMLEAFLGEPPIAYMGRHLDGNNLNNRLENLEWSTYKKNGEDRVRDNATTNLRCNFLDVQSVTYLGLHETYDIEVSGPWHNFSAGGMVVHNSLNEYSGRYSVMPMMFYRPDKEQVCKQSTENRQGRDCQLSDIEFADFDQNATKTLLNAEREYYQSLEMDVARETARLNLPLSTYTFCYWKMDLRNLFNVMSLRSDPHAQWEIQAFSDVICGIVERVAPLSFEAFQDYQQGAVTFSQLELTYLQRYFYMMNGADIQASVEESMAEDGMTKREIGEFFAKLRPKSKRNFSLDLSKVKTGQYFQKMMEDHAVVV